MDELTPTFNSMTPQRTSMVEFPVLAMEMIWIIRRIEQTVVRRPSRKTQMSAIFFLLLMLSLTRRGIGRKKMTMSKKMVIVAKP